MIKYLKGSLSRQFTFYMIVVLLLILAGGIVISTLNNTVQVTFAKEREEMLLKQQTIASIEENLQEMLLSGRGYFAYRNEEEMKQMQIASEALTENVQLLKSIANTNKEEDLVIRLQDFIEDYLTNVFPLGQSYAEAQDYEKLQSLSPNSSRSRELINFTKEIELESEEQLNALYIKHINNLNQFTFLYISYVVFVLLVIGIVIRKVIKEIGAPLRNFSLAAERVAYGQDVSFPQLTREDELGTLSRSFEKMIKSIQANEEEMTAQNEELIAQQETLNRQQNQLQQLLEETKASEEKLQLYNHFISSMTTSFEKQVVLKNIVTLMDRLFHTDKSMVVLVGTSEYEAIGISNDNAKRCIDSLQDSILIRLKQKKEVHLIQRDSTIAEQTYHDETLQSYDLYAPIFSDDNDLLAVYLSTRVGKRFTDSEIEDHLTLMKHAALSLEKLFLYEEAERNRQLNQDIINNVNEGIQLVGIDGRIMQVNDKFCELLTCSDSKNLLFIDLVAWKQILIQKVSNKEGLTAFLDQAISVESRAVSTFRYEIEASKKRVIEVYAESIIRDESKVGTLFVHRDITAEYEVDQMKSELVSTVSHELRTPLASVLGFTELMVAKELKPERQKKYLQTIHKEAKRLTNLINDFLDLQRMESGSQVYHKKPIDIIKVVNQVTDVFQDLERERRIFVTKNVEHAYISGDEERLVQLFTNLISNGVKFSPNGGDIELKIIKEQESILISVIDQGLGIPKNEISSLFQKFYRIDNSDRRKIGGTGLGLAIVKEIVEAHDGNITVTSTEGMGSTFTIFFPLLKEYEENDEQLDKERGIPNQQPVLVMVEDDNSLALLLKEQLVENGFYVLHYRDGEAAIKAIIENNPTLVVLDLMLEDSRLDGWAIVKAMKANKDTTNIPIIISSALEEKEKGISLGVNDYLIKPYPPNKLTSIILKTVLEGGRYGEILIPGSRE